MTIIPSRQRMRQVGRWFLLVVYAVVFAEFYCRWAIRDIRIGPSFTTADENHGWVMRRNFQGRRITREYDMTFRTGAQGFRGRSYSATKPAGTVRIASLGNSQAFGVGVNDDQTYAYLTERMLIDRTHHPVEVLNMAVADTGTGIILSMWDEILRYEPDLLLVRYDYWNFQDPFQLWAYRDGRLVKREQERAGRLRQMMEGNALVHQLEKSALYGHVRLVIPRYTRRLQETKERLKSKTWAMIRGVDQMVLIWRGIRHCLTDPPKPPAPLPMSTRSGAKEQEYRLVSELVRRARAAAVPLIFLKFELERDQAERFAAIASGPGVDVLDCTDMLNQEAYFYPIDEHLTPAGHAEVARRLTEFVLHRFGGLFAEPPGG